MVEVHAGGINAPLALDVQRDKGGSELQENSLIRFCLNRVSRKGQRSSEGWTKEEPTEKVVEGEPRGSRLAPEGNFKSPTPPLGALLHSVFEF